MLDIRCVVCGEPFEEYYITHDMTRSTRARLLAGEGCECCNGVVPKGRTADDQLRDIGRNVMTVENPNAVLCKLGF